MILEHRERGSFLGSQSSPSVGIVGGGRADQPPRRPCRRRPSGCSQVPGEAVDRDAGKRSLRGRGWKPRAAPPGAAATGPRPHRHQPDPAQAGLRDRDHAHALQVRPGRPGHAPGEGVEAGEAVPRPYPQRAGPVHQELAYRRPEAPGALGVPASTTARRAVGGVGPGGWRARAVRSARPARVTTGGAPLPRGRQSSRYEVRSGDTGRSSPSNVAARCPAPSRLGGTDRMAERPGDTGDAHDLSGPGERSVGEAARARPPGLEPTRSRGERVGTVPRGDEVRRFPVAGRKRTRPRRCGARARRRRRRGFRPPTDPRVLRCPLGDVLAPGPSPVRG